MKDTAIADDIRTSLDYAYETHSKYEFLDRVVKYIYNTVELARADERIKAQLTNLKTTPDLPRRE